ncbi:activator of Hsp70 and Hsp90 chaperone [Hysterangium stoloniferum]|nr:activator of Hsp70 and Hsp90 chaperone [Hysterangium stoloniferum]
MADVNELKTQGNKAFQAKQYDTAIDLFSQAIKLDPANHVLWSNRSAARAGKREWSEALADAEETIRVNPSWSKGYARKGAALHGAGKWDEAIAAYEAGLKIEDSDALKKGLKEVKEAREQDAGAGLGLGRIFSDPNMFAKLAINPKTSALLSDPAFAQKLSAIQQNPRLADSALQDPRMITVMGVLLGIDMQGFARDENSDEPLPGTSAQPPAPTHAPKPSAPAQSKPAEPEDVTMANPEPEEEDEEAKVKKEAEKEKQKGSEAYKKHDFATAAQAFEKAWELWPKDITFLTNLAAVYLEQGEYDKSIETSEKAVEEGRMIRADFKLIAKALGRVGTAYSKKGEYGDAIKWFEKSLTEHRTPDVLAKLKEAEKLKVEADKKAYFNPELSVTAREEGNALFKSGDFAGSVKSYTEAIKRDPTDPRGYNNRANAYTKLAALPEALKDAEQAIKVDPKFVKGYLRKSHVLFAMKEYTKAMQAVQEAQDADEEKKHKREIDEQLQKITMALYSQRADESEEDTIQRAMRDPEIAQIMGDPVMQQILSQAQQEPGALQDHMKNPGIRTKIQKLVAAGIIKTR